MPYDFAGVYRKEPAKAITPYAPNQEVVYNPNLKSASGVAKQNARIQGMQLTNQINAYNKYMPGLMTDVADSINSGSDLYQSGVTNTMAATNNAQNLAALGMSRTLKGAGINPGSTGYLQALNNLYSKYAQGNASNLYSLQQQEKQRKMQAQQMLASLVSNGAISSGSVNQAASAIPSVDLTSTLASLAGTLGSAAIVNGGSTKTKEGG